jgi:uncharacterized protein (TIGR00369 family)
MEPIADRQLLLERMRRVFPGDITPGLRLEILDVDREARTTNLRIQVDDNMSNQFGAVLGGTVASMSDSCIGIAGAAASGGVLAMPLAELNVIFVRPVPLGTVHGLGVVTRLGRRVGFIEGTLFDEERRVLARGTGTAIPTPFPTSTYATREASHGVTEPAEV